MAVGSWWALEPLRWLPGASTRSWWENGGSGRDVRSRGDVGSWEKVVGAVVGAGLGRVRKTRGLEKSDVVPLGEEGEEPDGCSTCDARQPRVAPHTPDPAAGSGTEKRRNECTGVMSPLHR